LGAAPANPYVAKLHRVGTGGNGSRRIHLGEVVLRWRTVTISCQKGKVVYRGRRTVTIVGIMHVRDIQKVASRAAYNARRLIGDCRNVIGKAKKTGGTGKVYIYCPCSVVAIYHPAIV
jgi:hypothetical protein